MENYIVRIYRRDRTDPRKVIGVLESVERETQQSFADLNTLSTLLECEPATSSTKSTSPTTRPRATLALAK
ncbi:MAG: hypothetical protein BMS9Abin06_0804 [Gammaproteobacteria bacterium]|nr:MAG: hypothetical protein BMS9Abin06_0804 [Gammaproteobacteria bacterium]